MELSGSTVVCPNCGIPPASNGQCERCHALWVDPHRLITRSAWIARRAEPKVFGEVKWFNNQRGYGFISVPKLGDVFVHFSAISAGPYASLAEGEQVSLRYETAPRGLSALDVTPIDVLPTQQHVLALEDDGAFSYLPSVIGPAATVAANDDQFEGVHFEGGFRSLTAAEDEARAFEALLNQPGLREQDLQEFLEAHPYFLLGDEYEVALPQVVLPFTDGASLRPDFVLRPVAGVTWDAEIVELKLPTMKLMRAKPLRREVLYATVFEAAAQLRSYQRYFEDEARRSAFAERLGFEVVRPRLALVFGRAIDFPPRRQLVQALDQIQPISLLSYDDLILRYQRLVAAARDGMQSGADSLPLKHN